MTRIKRSATGLAVASLLIVTMGCDDMKVEGPESVQFGDPVTLKATYKHKGDWKAVKPSDAEHIVSWQVGDRSFPGNQHELVVADDPSTPDVYEGLMPGKHKAKYQARHPVKKKKVDWSKDFELEVVNQRPVPTITSHGNGDSVDVGTSVTFTGSVRDLEDDRVGGIPTHKLSWYINGSHRGTGSTLSVSNLEPLPNGAPHKIALEATDRAGAKGRTEISVTINNRAPLPTISAIRNKNGTNLLNSGGTPTFGVTERVTFEGSAIDPDVVGNPFGGSNPGAIPSQNLSWHSSKDNHLGNGASFDTTTLNGGTHRITLRARDQYGKVGSSSSITIEVENQLPIITRVTRTPNSNRVSALTPITFRVEAYDPDGLAIDPNKIVWKTDVGVPDRTLGRGTSITIDDLKPTDHEVTVYVEDAHGGEAKHELRQFDVTNDAPQSVITSPTNGEQFYADQRLQLRGYGEDTEEGRVDEDNLTWLIQNQADSSKRKRIRGTDSHTVRIRRLVRDCGFGTWEIILEAEDKFGAEDEEPARRRITVLNRKPSDVRIMSPAMGQQNAVTEGDPITLMGRANDPDRGTALGSGSFRNNIVWRAVQVAQGGPTGIVREIPQKGERVELPAGLPAGRWRIEMTAIDPDEPNDLEMRVTVRARLRVRPKPATPPASAGNAGQPSGQPTGHNGGSLAGAVNNAGN